MGNVIESAIQSHFRAMTTPKPHPIELPPDPSYWYGWKSVVEALVVPEEVVDPVMNGAVEECSVLLLHGMMVKEMPLCTSLQQEHGIITRVLQWFTKMKTPLYAKREGGGREGRRGEREGGGRRRMGG